MKDGIDSEDVHLERPMSCDDLVQRFLSNPGWPTAGVMSIPPAGAIAACRMMVGRTTARLESRDHTSVRGIFAKPLCRHGFALNSVIIPMKYSEVD
jgi:hypothetical protein